MTTAAASSTTTIIGTSTKKSGAEANPAYRTKTSFVAAHFDEAGKGRIVFLPFGVTLRYRAIFLFARRLRGHVR